MSPAFQAFVVIALIASRWWISDLQSPWAANLWSAAAALAALLFYWPRRQIPRRPGQLVFDLALSLSLLGLISSLWSLDRTRSLNHAVLIAAVALFFWSAHRHQLVSALSLAWTAAIGSALASALALHQIFVGFPILRGLLQHGQLQPDAQTTNTILAGRAFGSFYAPDMLGAALAMAMALSFGLLFDKRNKLKLLTFLLISAQAAGLASTKSVGAMMALAMALLLLFVFALRKLSRAHLHIALSLSALFGLAILFVMRQRLAGAGYRLFQRLRNQLTAMRAFGEAPVLGHGFDSFAMIQPTVRQPGEALTRYAHGWVGQNFSDLGMVGGLLALFWFALILLYLWRQRPQTWLQIGAVAAAIAGMVHALIDYDLVFGENFSVLLTTLLVALGPGQEHSTAIEPGPVTQPQRTTFWEQKPAHQKILQGLVLLFVLSLAAYSSWRGINLALWEQAAQSSDCALVNRQQISLQRWAPPSAEMDTKLAKHLIACPVGRAEQLPRALKLFAGALNKRPHDQILRARYALLLAQTGQPQKALQQIDLALDAWPKVGRMWNLRARIAFVLGEEPASIERYLSRATSLDPHDPQLETTRAALRAASQGRPAAGLRRQDK